MELLHCPICNKAHLTPLPRKFKASESDAVLCENEDYIHLVRFGKHYLVRTTDNIMAEMQMEDLILAN